MNYFTSMPYNDFRLRDKEPSLEQQIDTYRFKCEMAEMKRMGLKPDKDYIKYLDMKMKKEGLDFKNSEDYKKYCEIRKERYQKSFMLTLGGRL
ncbi:MAG: hypothetical protein QW666_02370 [Candidatus Woesearchaeota archaeon]